MNPVYWKKCSVFITFFVCCIIIVLLSSSLATDYWIVSSGRREGVITSVTSAGSIHFGLFNGVKKLDSGLGQRIFAIKVVCLGGGGQHVCMFSCGRTATDRQADLTDLLFTAGRNWSELDNCRSVAALSALLPSINDNTSVVVPSINTSASSRVARHGELDSQHVTELRHREPQFMLYGVWMATIGTMCASLLLTLTAVGFAILNTATNPVEWITGVPGLYLWNVGAMMFEMVSMSLWAVQYYQRLQHSVFWRQELTEGWTSEGMARYGYSYWLVLVAILLHLVNIAVLWYGTREKRPRKVHVPIDGGQANAINMIY